MQLQPNPYLVAGYPFPLQLIHMFLQAMLILSYVAVVNHMWSHFNGYLLMSLYTIDRVRQETGNSSTEVKLCFHTSGTGAHTHSFELINK